MNALRRFLLLLLILCSAVVSIAEAAGELRMSMRHDPRTFDPQLVDEDAGETVRYLTGGVLLRVNRSSHKVEPELAQSWTLREGGRLLSIELRPNLKFCDGTPLTAEDVAWTFKRLMDPELKSPTGDSFRSGAGNIQVTVVGPTRLNIRFPAAVASIERLLDQVAIQSARSPLKERAVAGPFMLREYKQGAHLLLSRNPHYWKKDKSGVQLPYLNSIRFDIRASQDLEPMRLQRGEVHIVENLDPETLDRLKSQARVRAIDAGATTDFEMIWFNQNPKAPLPEYKKAWFQSREFRKAVSASVNRHDLVRLVYRGYAAPAAGPVPPSSIWFNKDLRAQELEPANARKLLSAAGFRYAANQLQDSKGNAVVFSLVTNSNNKARNRIAALVQQDLAKIGIQLNLVALDFRSLIERISKTFDYEACLLGMVNVDDDPNGQMNLWLSSSANHPWYPAQASPATPWEAEIDNLMRLQASSANLRARKSAFDKVQAIALRETPVIFLVNRHALAALSPAIQNVVPAPVRPHLLWNVEHLKYSTPADRNAHLTRR